MKTFTFIASFLSLISCGEAKKGSSSDNATSIKDGWTELRIDELKSVCANDFFTRKASDRVTPDSARKMCSCYVDELSTHFTYYELDNLPIEFRNDKAQQCAVRSGLSWSVENGVYLNLGEEDL